MAIMMRMAWQGATPAQYDQVKNLTDFVNDVPSGLIAHACAFEGGTMHVVDVWESADHFDRFMASRIVPAVQQAGIAGQPEVQILPTHFEFTPGAAR